MKKFNIGYYAMITLKGFVRVIIGALNAGLIYLAVCGFTLVASEDGYAAVADFVGSVSLLIIACALIYLLGCGFPFMGKKHVA